MVNYEAADKSNAAANPLFKNPVKTHINALFHILTSK